MEIRTSVFKRKSGRHKGKWTLEIKYLDEKTGRWRSVARQFEKQSDAKDARPELEREIRKSDGQIQTGKKMTFSDLCEHAKATFYKPAVIIQGDQIDGIRSHRSTYGFMKNLEEYFGKKRIGQIKTSDLTAYKVWRFEQGSRRGKTKEKIEISHTTVNRELMVMRHLMKYAYAEGWIGRDIFQGQGSKLINKRAEKKRDDRTLTSAEEALLLSMCQGTRLVPYKWKRKGIEKDVTAKFDADNPELRAIILLGLDSAMRRGEILKLRWKDIDFENQTIRIIGAHTKTLQERLTLLSKRTASELKRLPTFGKSPDVFSVTDFKRSWNTAKRLAGIDNLTFHDLRGTSITRMIMCGVPRDVASKIAGHAPQDITSRHYLAANAETVRWVADRIDQHNEGGISIIECSVDRPPTDEQGQAEEFVN